VPTIEELLTAQQKYELSLHPKDKLDNLITFWKDKHKLNEKEISEFYELLSKVVQDAAENWEGEYIP
jgi:hypothetical protein